MNYKKIVDVKSKKTGISGFFSAYGSFGAVDGMDRDIKKIEETENGYVFTDEKIKVESKFESLSCGICSRKDTFVAFEDTVLNSFSSRFLLEGGEYEIYTQYSAWQNESNGSWQPLVTSCEVSNFGVRFEDGASPMAAVRNKATGKIIVFHLLPNAQWKIKITRLPFHERLEAVAVELGIGDRGLSLNCKKDEVIEMPQILFYETENTRDLDCWRLHKAYNDLYPRRQLPVIYNSWMLGFDTIDIDDLFRQVDTAAELGVEMFLLDAGWFGDRDAWSDAIGDWFENTEFGYKGRLSEVSEYIRSKGLKFGMWVEPERALVSSNIYNEHPEHFILGSGGNAFLNFADEKALFYITETVLNIIEKYNVGFLKFDFNAQLSYDPSGQGFYPYFKGVRKFIAAIREKYPDIYITNCASGGYRMDMANNALYDSVWSSDNQSPIASVRIIRDTALRLPVCHIERWDVRRYFNGFPKYGSKTKVSLPISCNNATWECVAAVRESYTHGLLTGGVMGFSTDIAAYPDEEKQALKELILNHKENREFYKNAVTRIIYKSTDITALQYSDVDLNKIEVLIFSEVIHQDSVTVYPVVEKNKTYILNGEEISGEKILEEGVTVHIGDYECVTIKLNIVD